MASDCEITLKYDVICLVFELALDLDKRDFELDEHALRALTAGTGVGECDATVGFFCFCVNKVNKGLSGFLFSIILSGEIHLLLETLRRGE